MASSLNQTLREITEAKIDALKKQRDAVHEHFDKVSVAAAEATSMRDKATTLYEGLKSSPVATSSSTISLSAMNSFLRTSLHDLSVGDDLYQFWIDSCNKAVAHIKLQTDYAFTYAQVLQTSWEDLGASKNDDVDMTAVAVDDDDSEQTWETVPKDVGKPEHLRVRDQMIKQLSDRVREQAPFNAPQFRAFLDAKVLPKDDADVKEVMGRVRTKVGQFCACLAHLTVHNRDITACINGLLASDLLCEEKKATLREIKTNDTIAGELATFVTSMLRKAKTWDWPAEGVFVDTRRTISGRYRAFLDESITTAIFLQYIGTHLTVTIRTALIGIYNSHLWRRTETETNSIEARRLHVHSEMMLAGLPESFNMQRSTGYSEEETSSSTDKVDTKQRMMHLLSVEAELHQALAPQQPFTIVRTDVEWFGPSIPHEAICVLLEHLGVTHEWVSFIRRFLRVPMVFERNGKAAPMIRERGVPIAHAFSFLFGEMVLFMMDLYVNKLTGINLYRMHDDICFFDRDPDTAGQAWKAMQEYAALTCLRFNEKSGSISVLSPALRAKRGITTADSLFDGPVVHGKAPLPQDKVRWGSLLLYSDGVFRISWDAMAPRVADMRDRLAAANSVLSWINVYNRFMRFFLRNFGKHAGVLGLQHVDQVIHMLTRINREALPDYGGNVMLALKQRFTPLHGVKMLETWVCWPIGEGGLGLRNEIINMSSLRDSVENERTPQQVFEDLMALDEKNWQRQEKVKEDKRKADPHWQLSHEQYRTLASETWEQYKAKRETKLYEWCSAYLQLLKLTRYQDTESAYQERLRQYYNRQLTTELGSECFVQEHMVPAALVESLSAKAIKWDDGSH
ncbi:hypothetical protein RI367_001066 [Sorochytrium milnesiophthora]